jgi:methionine sulfoxide reductase heme-binding subunit
LLHFFWMKAAKNNFAEWSVYAVIMGVLLGWRVLKALKTREQGIAAAAAPTRGAPARLAPD